MSSSSSGDAAPAAEADRDENEITEADRAVLRDIIREEIRGLLPKLGGESSSPTGGTAGPEPAGGDLESADPSSLSLRQITERSLIMASKALDKIPGAAKAAPDPKKPAPEKAPVGRGLRWLGFHDE